MNGRAIPGAYLFHLYVCERREITFRLTNVIPKGIIFVSRGITVHAFLFLFYDGFYMFRQNNAILSERLCSFLSHFSVNMVGDKSECNKIIQQMYTSIVTV